MLLYACCCLLQQLLAQPKVLFASACRIPELRTSEYSWTSGILFVLLCLSLFFFCFVHRGPPSLTVCSCLGQACLKLSMRIDKFSIQKCSNYLSAIPAFRERLILKGATPRFKLNLTHFVAVPLVEGHQAGLKHSCQGSRDSCPQRDIATRPSGCYRSSGCGVKGHHQ